MRRAGALLVCALAVCAAAPHRLPLPLPPQPPEQPPNDEAAPVPDLDIHAPPAVVSDTATISPRVFGLRDHEPGAGFIPGSRYESPEERRPLQTPGLTVRLPLR